MRGLAFRTTVDLDNRIDGGFEGQAEAVLRQRPVELHENVVAGCQGPAAGPSDDHAGWCGAGILRHAVGDHQLIGTGDAHRRRADAGRRLSQRRHGPQQLLEIGIVVAFDAPRRQSDGGQPFGECRGAGAAHLLDERQLGRTEPHGKRNAHQAAAPSKPA